MIPSLYEPLKEWARTGSICILSDLHFDDPDCLLMDPSWISPKEQLEIINKTVQKCDTFVCLGDVGDAKYVSRINAGKKILIMGNHDKKSLVSDAFDEVYEGPVFISSRILLSHEPVTGLSWCLNIHGHDHSGVENYKEGCPHINLAAKVCGYTPVNLGKLIKSGVLSGLDDIHRKTIDRATDKALKGKGWNHHNEKDTDTVCEGV